jgi:hypothetical protein
MKKRVDTNQAEIVKALRAAGYYVFDQHAHGRGLPDLLVCSKSGIGVQVEVKMPGESFTLAESIFWNKYPGQKAVVRTVEQAIWTMEYYDGFELAAK